MEEEEEEEGRRDILRQEIDGRMRGSQISTLVVGTTAFLGAGRGVLRV